MDYKCYYTNLGADRNAGEKETQKRVLQSFHENNRINSRLPHARFAPIFLKIIQGATMQYSLVSGSCNKIMYKK